MSAMRTRLTEPKEDATTFFDPDGICEEIYDELIDDISPADASRSPENTNTMDPMTSEAAAL